jgi:hypothetical protein
VAKKEQDVGAMSQSVFSKKYFSAVVPRVKPPLKVRNEQDHGIKATAGVEQHKNQRSWDNSPPTMEARPLSSTDRPLKASIDSGATKQRCQVVMYDSP